MKLAESYHLDQFEDCGTYYHSILPQGGNEALEQRLPFLTSTAISAALDYSDFETPVQLATRIRKRLGLEKKNAAMEHGNFYESIARDLYSMITGRKVLPVNMGVSKRDPRRAGTPDGLIDDDPEGPGMVEFKCPYGKMYPAILSYLAAKVKPSGCGHIYLSHLLQMMNNMEIFVRKWCDYVVLYVKPDDLPSAPSKPILFIQRIYFSQEYWDRQIAPMINEFFMVHLADLPVLKIKTQKP